MSAFSVVRLHFISLLQKWCALSYKILINLLLNREPSLPSLLRQFICGVFLFCCAFCWFHQRMRSYRTERLQVRNNAARTTFCMQFMHLHVEKSREINRCAARIFFLFCLFFSRSSYSVEHLMFTRRYQRIGWKKRWFSHFFFSIFLMPIAFYGYGWHFLVWFYF